MKLDPTQNTLVEDVKERGIQQALAGLRKMHPAMLPRIKETASRDPILAEAVRRFEAGQ